MLVHEPVNLKQGQSGFWDSSIQKDLRCYKHLNGLAQVKLLVLYKLLLIKQSIYI
jgi:hypothetical protein